MASKYVTFQEYKDSKEAIQNEIIDIFKLKPREIQGLKEIEDIETEELPIDRKDTYNTEQLWYSGVHFLTIYGIGHYNWGTLVVRLPNSVEDEVHDWNHRRYLRKDHIYFPIPDSYHVPRASEPWYTRIKDNKGIGRYEPQFTTGRTWKQLINDPCFLSFYQFDGPYDIDWPYTEEVFNEFKRAVEDFNDCHPATKITPRTWPVYPSEFKREVWTRKSFRTIS